MTDPWRFQFLGWGFSLRGPLLQLAEGGPRSALSTRHTIVTLSTASRDCGRSLNPSFRHL